MERFFIDKTNRKIKIKPAPRRKYRSPDGTFDVILKEKWDAAMADGYFSHELDSVVRHFEGERGWVGVFCPSRVSKKRPAPNFQTVKTAFPTGFNFTKVKDEEKLFEVDNNGTLYQVIINNSPYEYGHSLIVPEPERHLPQLLNAETVETVIELMFQSNQIGLRMMFNSVCACATVNHLHLHCYYTDYRIPAEDIECEPIHSTASKTGTGGTPREEFLYAIKGTFPVRGLILEVTERNMYKVAQFTAVLCERMADDNMAHNVAFIRGKRLNHELDSDEFILRVYIWPRRPLLGVKQYEDFNCAVTELIGHCYFGSENQHQTWISDDIVQTLSAYDIGENFEKVTKNAIQLFDMVFA